jgi:type I restriction enzyme M protein
MMPRATLRKRETLMAPTTKETQRAELHKMIWRIANDLRGSVDGWDFKQYVLGLLFYRFISENLAAYLDAHEHDAGNAEFEYARLPDSDAWQIREDIVAEKGYFIFPRELFANVRAAAASDENLNETLQRVFANIEGSAVGTESEADVKGLFDDLDVNSSKLGPTVAKRNEKLVKLLDAIGDLPLGTFSDNTIDLFGDAYEYLMQMYASQAGKSGGEYYTPQEVSELLARITVLGKTEVNKVYDPAAGSGSLLLKFAKVLGKDNVRQGFYGQEINLTTYNLARINMFLHDINFEQFHIAHGDTLLDPAHWDDEPFEAIVSNPRTPSSGTATRTPCSSTTHASRRLACSRRSRRLTSRSRCTSCRGWR